jgi:hypothetical protein
MLSILLETIGILGVLVSLAANFGKPCIDAMARRRRKRPHATILAFPPMHGKSPTAERRHRIKIPLVVNTQRYDMRLSPVNISDIELQLTLRKCRIQPILWD